MLSPRQRIVRSSAVVLVFAGLVAGTFWGNDEHFPLGPFRMYSVTNSLDGEIRAIYLEGVAASGEEFRLDFGDLGLRRAEVEGQLERDTPDVVLPLLVNSFNRRNPEIGPLRELRLVEEVHQLRGGHVVSTVANTIGEWEAT
ncbi:MAG: hypothetical protein M3285_04215 [Actinomycetota bacterium]|nr:hypothetical protein [Actinomycetota bacterium]